MSENVFTVYGDEGRISKSMQVFGNPDYGNALHKIGDRFIQHGGNGHANLETDWVSGGELCKRPVMSISVNKKRIKAGGKDVAQIRGIPLGALVQVVAGGYVIGEERQPGTGAFPIASDAPATFTVTVSLWPYQDWSCKVEAVA